MKKKPERRLNALTLVLRTMVVNKKRCFFAVLGVIIGIAAVTTLASLGHSSQRALALELEKLGTNMLIIEAARSHQGRGGQGPTVRTLTENDIAVLLDKVDGIEAAAPVLFLPGSVKTGDAVVNTGVLATRAAFMKIRGTDTSQGSLFSDEEGTATQKVILLGQTVAALLFGDTNPVGETVEIDNIVFEVMGVLSEKGLDADGEDQDDMVIIPLTVAQQHLGREEHLTHIYLKTTETEIIPAVKEGIMSALRAAHQLEADEPADFNVLDQAELLAARTDILGSVEDLINVLVVITLLAGGLGITAVQLISIRERTWEIGLHRAMGARKKDITIQFLFESAILGGVGGLFGVALGLIAPLAVASAFSLVPAIAWPALIISLIVSVMLGIAAGIYPAFYASRLDPVVALRSA